MATLITEFEYREAADNYTGWCKKCHDFTRDECEPDARRYGCPVCEQRTVYGAEEALMMGLIEFKEDSDE